MKRVVTVTATYHGDPDRIFSDAVDFQHLSDVMSDIAHYQGLPDGPVHAGMVATVDVTFWGWLKVRGHHMRVETYDPVMRHLQSREHAPGITQWDHVLDITPDGDHVVWTDQIALDAGWKTPCVALFCRYVYRHRHKRRKALTVRSKIQPLTIT